MLVQQVRPARIALVGERSPESYAHSRYLPLMSALRHWDRVVLDAYWKSTVDVARDPASLRRFDGVWLTPGSPYSSEAGAVAAVRTAREHDIPFLATCGGFSHVLLEFARNVCGLSQVAHPEYASRSAELLVTPPVPGGAGHERQATLAAGSLVAEVVGAARTMERYHSAHKVVERYSALLQAHGLRFTAHDDGGQPCVAELPDRRFFLAASFQPELAAESSRPHPIVRAFGAAVAQKGRIS